MKDQLTTSLLLIACLLVAAPVWAHHGQGLSFDTTHVWWTWAKVEEFSYINPHPAMKFTRTDKNGKVEHWSAELGNNPSRMARDGWTKGRSIAALMPGTRIKVYIGTSLAGGYSGIINRIENEKGEAVVETSNAPKDTMAMDGVPGGYQPTPEDRAKAAQNANAAIDVYEKGQK